MRQILPAITMVILLCFATQTLVEEFRFNAASEESASCTRAANAAAIEAIRATPPTSQPATRPVVSDESMSLANPNEGDRTLYSGE